VQIDGRRKIVRDAFTWLWRGKACCAIPFDHNERNNPKRDCSGKNAIKHKRGGIDCSLFEGSPTEERVARKRDHRQKCENKNASGLHRLTFLRAALFCVNS